MAKKRYLVKDKDGNTRIAVGTEKSRTVHDSKGKRYGKKKAKKLD